MTHGVAFWFEFASTYSYLSAMRIQALCAERNVPLTWQPLPLGPIFAAYGWRDSPFNLFPAKGANMWRDMERECARLDLPLQRPDVFPQNSMLAARTICGVIDDPRAPDLIRAIYSANFAQNRNISDPAVLGDLLTATGFDAASALAAAQTPEGKARLRAQSDTAAALGIYGAPSFVVDGELFWGNDRLERALDWATSDTGGGHRAAER
ncbi:MAG: 2-hydroxychromene-2-carboxylate isomerase [Rhodobacteraceae bacterium]|nr:2-hydroxychromene-2-carboxylate isomerase [Paracoccaceae bacterium]